MQRRSTGATSLDNDAGSSSFMLRGAESWYFTKEKVSKIPEILTNGTETKISVSTEWVEHFVILQLQGPVRQLFYRRFLERKLLGHELSGR